MSTNRYSQQEFLEKYADGVFDSKSIPPKPFDFDAPYLIPPIAKNEKQRTKALWYYQIDRTLADQFKKVLDLSYHLFDVESVLITLLDDDMTINYNRSDSAADDLKKENSFCGHAILSKTTFVVEDASIDWRFIGNPIVTKPNGVRFYAGSPIKVSGIDDDDSDYSAGMMCLVDSKPKKFSVEEETKLKFLSDVLRDELGLWLKSKQVEMRNAMSASLTKYTSMLQDAKDLDFIAIAEKFIKDTLVVPFVQILTKENGQVHFNDKTIPVNETFIWEVDDLSERAITVPIADSEEDLVITVYTNDKKQIFDQYDVEYIRQFSQNILVLLQQQTVIKANTAKTVFIESISHELRTPLHGILSTTELMLEDKQMTSTQKSMMQVVQSSGKNVISIINSLLDFQKWDSKTIRITSDTFNVFDLQQDVMDAMYMNADYTNVQMLIDTEISWECGMLYGDSGCIKQILLNLVDNAVKFTKNGHIIMKSYYDEADDLLTFVVEDTGSGMSRDFIEKRLFLPFEKENDFMQGAGISLSISQKLAKAMKGIITVDKSDSSGSIFRLSMPVSKSQYNDQFFVPHFNWYYIIKSELDLFLELQTKMLRNNLGFKENGITGSESVYLEIINYNEEFDLKKISHSGYTMIFTSSDLAPLLPERVMENERVLVMTKPVGLSKLKLGIKQLEERQSNFLVKKITEDKIKSKALKVLIVDDNAINRNMLAMYCKNRKMMYKMASDGFEAVDLYEKNVFDMILMDIQMPRCDGPTAVKLIRQKEVSGKKEPVLIIMLTGLSTDDMKEMCYRYGADGYYVKPISLKTIDNVIREYFT